MLLQENFCTLLQMVFGCNYFMLSLGTSRLLWLTLHLLRNIKPLCRILPLRITEFHGKITHEGSSATLDTLPPGTMALHVGFSVSGLQIDNQLHTTQYPVFLHTDHNAKEGALRLPSTLDISSDIPEGPEYSFLADSNSTMISQVASILKSRSDPVRQSVSRSGRNGRPRR